MKNKSANKKMIWVAVAAVAILVAAAIIYFSLRETSNEKGSTEMGASADYKLDVQMDDQNRFRISADINVLNESNEAFEDLGFYLIPNAINPDDMAELAQASAEIAVESVKRGDEELSYSLENNKLLVELEAGLEPESTEEISVAYTLKLPENGMRLSQDGDNYFLAQWYPMLAQYDKGWDIQDFDMNGESYHSGFGDFEVSYTLLNEYLVASSATEGSIQPSSSGTVKGERIKDFYLAFLNTEEWLSESVEVNETVLRLFMPRDQEFMDENIVKAKAAYAFFEERIGDNPFPELDIIANDGYMEYPNVIEVASTWDALDEVLVHEIGHQWFYYIVGNDPYEDAWLDESITEFATSIFLSDYYQDEDYGFRSAQMAADAYRQEKYANLPLSEYNEGEYVSTVYGEAPLVLRNFFEERGGSDEALEFLAAYYEEYQFKYVNTPTFKDFFTSYYGEEHREFLDSWLQ
ncbi:M1 family metallopeptidase [Planomicrobium chinense]|uniref:M1 family metallopeptidase n=1 Tax=Planococcus chinensis TaxID=272917 RepID=UPI001CC57A2A|nr:M1 family metallopeptidase [Planococcus chinensis]MBZ5201106.1 M1 family metallopeptidase [Planococcus chinensis]